MEALSLWLPGTLLYRRDLRIGVVDHYGIVVHSHPCIVAHIDKSDAWTLNVKIEPYATFAAGLPVEAEPVVTPVPRHELWSRIEGVRQSRLPFGLMCWGRDWNCETFSRYVRAGVAESRQAARAKAVIFGIGAVWLLGKLFGGGDDAPRPEFDASVGRYRDEAGRFVPGARS